MLRMLIAEDDRIILDGLSNCVDWHKLGITDIQTARNGKQALETALHFNPHLILSDIVMPKMDGVELANIISKKLPQCKMIFITGHWELEYCKSAFKNGVVDYILKPVDIEELENTVRKTLKDIQTKISMDDFLKGTEIKLQQAMPLLKAKFFTSLLNGKITDEKYISERLSLLETGLPLKGIYEVLSIYIDDDSDFYGTGTALKKGLFEVALSDKISEIIARHCSGLCIEAQERQYSCILCFNEDILDEQDLTPENVISDIAQEIQDTLLQQLGISVTIGVGQWVYSLQALHQSARSAEQRMHQRFYAGPGHILLADRATQQQDGAFSYHEIQKITDLLQASDINYAVTSINNLLDRLKTQDSANMGYSLGICAQIYAVLMGSMLEMTNFDSGILTEKCTDFNRILHAQTLDGARETLVELCTCIHNRLKESRETESETIVRIKKFVKNNYKEKISVAQIADHVYLSLSYICLLFKQETGTTINQYITDLRIRESARLIRETDLRMIDISMEVGYNDEKYWARLFKNKMGMNPSEYKIK